MQVILYQPEIPQNTGNIVRTCKLTGNQLALVPPLGFSLTDRMLKRAGLDYLKGFPFKLIDSLPPYLEKSESNFYFFSSRAQQLYTEVHYTSQDILIFGSETKGLPPLFLSQWPERFLKIPMLPSSRCLNLSNAVAIVIYEAWKQLSFAIPL